MVEQGVRSEYLDFIVDKSYSDIVLNEFINYIDKNIKWDYFILSDIKTNTNTYKSIKENLLFNK